MTTDPAAPGPARPPRRLWQRTWPVLAALPVAAAGAAVLAAATWLVVNLVDDPPEPLPASLVQPEARLDDAHNGFFWLAGIWAPADHDPHAAGTLTFVRQEKWRETASPFASQEPSTRLQRVDLRLPKDALPSCPDNLACFDRWLASAPALDRLLAAHRVLVGRCERMADAWAYDELPGLPHAGPDERPVSALPMVECTDLLRAAASASWARHDAAEAVQQARRQHELARKVYEGSRTLLTGVLAARALRRSQLWLAEMAARRPELQASLRFAVRPFAPGSASAARWLRTEAERGLANITGLARGCMERQQHRSDDERAFRDLWCEHPPGVLLQHTWNEHQAAWSELVALSEAPAPQAGAAFLALGRREAPAGFRFRNTFGARLPLPGQWFPAHYVARPWDVEVGREMLALALDLAQRPGASDAVVARALREAALSPSGADRIAWDPQRRALVATSWEETLGGAAPLARPIFLPVAVRVPVGPAPRP